MFSCYLEKEAVDLEIEHVWRIEDSTLSLKTTELEVVGRQERYLRADRSRVVAGMRSGYRPDEWCGGVGVELI